jgi:hypothetical protein
MNNPSTQGAPYGQQPQQPAQPQQTTQTQAAPAAAQTQTVTVSQKLSPMALWGLALGLLIGGASEWKGGGGAAKVVLGAAVGGVTGASMGILLGDVIASSK